MKSGENTRTQGGILGDHSRGGSAWKMRASLWQAVCRFLSRLPMPWRRRKPGEYRVKLAFLYNFAQFVEWPADTFRDSGSPRTSVWRRQSFSRRHRAEPPGAYLGGPSHRSEETPTGRGSPRLPDGFRESYGRETPRILANSKGSSTLTVGEAKGFAQRGGIINLTREENGCDSKSTSMPPRNPT